MPTLRLDSDDMADVILSLSLSLVLIFYFIFCVNYWIAEVEISK